MRTTDAYYSPAHQDVIVNVALTGAQLVTLKEAFKASVVEWPAAHEVALHDMLVNALVAVANARQDAGLLR